LIPSAPEALPGSAGSSGGERQELTFLGVFRHGLRHGLDVLKIKFIIVMMLKGDGFSV